MTGWLLYQIPPINERLAWRVEGLQARLRYAINPPEQAVFQPAGQPLPNLADTLPTCHALLHADSHPNSAWPNRDSGSYRHAHSDPHTHPFPGYANWDHPYVSDVEQLRTSQPGHGAVILGLEGRPARHCRNSQAEQAR